MTPSVRRVRGVELDVSAARPDPMGADGLTYDAAEAVAHLRACSNEFASLIDAAGAFAVGPEAVVDPFPYLLRSIVFQQLNGTAARTIHARVLDLFGGVDPTPEQLHATSVERLRSAGVSGNKAASMHDLAHHAAAGELPTRDELPALSDLQLVDRLTVVRGIGPWTVHMLLMFRLGRPDVLPTGDFGVREGYRLVHGLEEQPTPSQLRALAEPWRPFRSVASWYLWRAVDLHRDGRLPIVGTT